MAPKSVAVVALDDPFGRVYGGSMRTRAMIDALLDAGCAVDVVYAGARHDGAVRPDLTLHPMDAVPAGERTAGSLLVRAKRQLLPVPTLTGARLPVFEKALSELKPDLLYVSQLRAAQYARSAPQSMLWLDMADLISDFARSEAAVRRGPWKLSASLQARHLARHEVAWARRAAIVSTAGHADALAISGSAGVRADWLPTPVTAEPKAGPPPRTRTAGFLGNFGYWPNVDAYEVLIRDWLPKLDGQGWSFVVAGYESDALTPHPRVECLGAVDEPARFYDEVDVVLAPIRLGGGIKVKVVEAIAHGRPVLATYAAVEGIAPEFRQAIRVVEGSPAVDQLDALLAVTSDDFQPARKRFSPPAFVATVDDLLAGAGAAR